MSAILSFATPDAAYMITDRAGYDSDGVVRQIGCKVDASIRRLAIVTRGDVRVGDHWARHLLALVNDKGIHGAVAMLPGILATMSADPVLRAAQSGERYVEVTLAGWSPVGGGFHLRFDTAEWRVKELSALAYAGPMDADPRQFFLYPNDGETPESWMRRGGVAMMEAFRNQRGRDKDGVMADWYAIGGGLDLTVVDANGVRTETILEWSDVVGEKIRPRRVAALADEAEARSDLPLRVSTLPRGLRQEGGREAYRDPSNQRREGHDQSRHIGNVLPRHQGRP